MTQQLFDEAQPPRRHWMIMYDEHDGEPYGVICNCNLGQDHNGNGDLMA